VIDGDPLEQCAHLSNDTGRGAKNQARWLNTVHSVAGLDGFDPTWYIPAPATDRLACNVPRPPPGVRDATPGFDHDRKHAPARRHTDTLTADRVEHPRSALHMAGQVPLTAEQALAAYGTPVEKHDERHVPDVADVDRIVKVFGVAGQIRHRPPRNRVGISVHPALQPGTACIIVEAARSHSGGQIGNLVGGRNPHRHDRPAASGGQRRGCHRVHEIRHQIASVQRVTGTDRHLPVSALGTVELDAANQTTRSPRTRFGD
jgi:hypothetical protein